MKFGFLGAGNMSSAIIKAIAGGELAASKDIIVYDVSESAINKLRSSVNVETASSYDELLSQSQYLFLGVKPNICLSQLPVLSLLLQKYKPVTVSFAAGISLEKIEKLIGDKLPVIRVMPNVNALVNESMSAICRNSYVNDEAYEYIKKVFSAIGVIFDISEEQFPVFSAIASCSPAFTYMYIDLLARGGQKFGMNKELATKIAAQAVLGSGKMVLESEKHPYALIDTVCSPGGTTIEGVTTLSKHGFEDAIVAAVEACIEKDKSIAEKG